MSLKLYHYLVLSILLVVCFADDSNDEIELNEKTRNPKSFYYVNSDTFYKTNPDPRLYYRPMQTYYVNSPFYSENIPQVYGLYELSQHQPFPYMIPVSDEIVSQVTDPMYQNKFLSSSHKGSDPELVALCKGKRTQIPSPKSCSGYVNCWDSIAVEQECPGELLFSDAGYCDYPHRVDCGSRPSKAIKEVCTEEFSTYRSPDNCGVFFVCVNAEPVKFQCPADLYYSEKLGVCDYLNRVQCKAMEPAQTTTIISSASSSSYQTPSTPESTSSSAEGATDSAVMPYIAMSRQDALRQLEERRSMYGNRMNFAKPTFGNIAPYAF